MKYTHVNGVWSGPGWSGTQLGNIRQQSGISGHFFPCFNASFLLRAVVNYNQQLLMLLFFCFFSPEAVCSALCDQFFCSFPQHFSCYAFNHVSPTTATVHLILRGMNTLFVFICGEGCSWAWWGGIGSWGDTALLIIPDFDPRWDN